MIDQDLKDLMETEGGRRFIYRLLQDCGTDNTALIIDPYASTYHLGRRSVGMDLLKRIRDLPGGWELEWQMRMEARAQPQEKPKRDFYGQFTGVNEND